MLLSNEKLRNGGGFALASDPVSCIQYRALRCVDQLLRYISITRYMDPWQEHCHVGYPSFDCLTLQE